MENVVIYTCITGGYDKLLQPAVVEDGFDFVCFVGPGEKTCEREGVWEIRELDCGLSDPALLSRYAKMHPHVLFPEYEASVWIDGNIEILDGTLYRCVRTKVTAGVPYSGVPHYARDCSYAEAVKCRDMRYLNYFGLLKVWCWLFFNRLPRHAGLMENNLIFRRHNNPDVAAFDENWWNCVMKVSRRDQLSLMVCLRKAGLRRDYLLPHSQSTRNNPGFRYLLHKKNQ